MRNTLKRSWACLAVAAAWSAASAADGQAGANLLRNGSFEGGRRYWHQMDDRAVIAGDAAHGRHALRIAKGAVQSAAFLLKQNVPVTISFSAKGERPMTIGWQCTPCAREIGTRHGLCWGMKHHHPVKITDQWKRYSFTFTPSVPQEGIWPRPTYMLQLGDGDGPWLLDAVSVACQAGADAYVPWREVEVAVDCPDLKGYRDASANLLEKGQPITLTARACNTSDRARTVTLRWQLVDYEGDRPLGQAVEKQVTVPPGETIGEKAQMKLTHSGLVLGRVSAMEDRTLLDRSDIPLCSLPYPKAAAKPDWRERFGGSLWGLHQAGQYRKIGFAWTRWHPHFDFSRAKPKGPDDWVWHDQRIDELAALGISCHGVLYGRPKWAFAGDKDLLPKDMNWPADDPRWDNLTPQCEWDRFVLETIRHYRGKSIVWEIENEPELNWPDKQKDLYAAFTIRTARLIKQTDPQAKVMVDNVYGIPSGINRHLLAKGGGKHIDIISWHDYHEGWLADGVAMRRMRNTLEELGCGHIEIWFNEGWAYTNTAVDEPAHALTNLTSSQSTNAMVDCLAELTVNGQEKTILFHTGYETHGMSFWDYYGPGTMLWDWYGYPMPLVPAYNVLAHHIGLSKAAGFIRPVGANLCVFDDVRNGRAVLVAYADRGSRADVTLELPLRQIAAEDAMGNAADLAGGKLTLSRTGRPVFVYSTAAQAGKAWVEALAGLDRKHASFVSAGGKGQAVVYKLPTAWEGVKKDSAEGNPVLVEGRPTWRLDQVWPVEPDKKESYRPLVWRDGWWLATEHTFGGQPKAEMKDGGVRLEFRAPHNNSPGEKLCSLSFVAPRDHTYSVSGQAAMRLWDGGNPVRLSVLHKTVEGAREVASVTLAKGKAVPMGGIQVTMAAGDELVFLPRIAGMFTGGDVTLLELAVTAGGTQGRAFRLPQAWAGLKKGASEGNPLLLDGKAIWRLDHVWPDDPTIAANFAPLPWNGTSWQPSANTMGGQPDVRVEDGCLRAAVRGPWTGKQNQRIAGLAFVAPVSGIYVASGTFRSKPWEGKATVFRLGLFKKDTQRGVLVKTVETGRDDTPAPFEVEVELSQGHELVFMPLMPDWHNATTVRVDNLVVREKRTSGPESDERPRSPER